MSRNEDYNFRSSPWELTLMLRTMVIILGLFEVVDRKAKLVVSELSEEQSHAQTAASNGQGSQTRKTKPKKKKKVFSNDLPIANATPEEESSTLASKADVVLSPGKEGIVSSTEDDRTTSDKSTTQVNKRKPDDNDNTIPVLEIPSTDGLVVEAGKQIPDGMDTSAGIADVEVIAPTSKTELTNVNASDVHEEHLLSTPNKEAVVINKEHQDEEQSNKLGSVETISKIDREMSESAPTEFQDNGESQTKDDSNKVQSPVNQKHQENSADKSSIKVQDQLEEAQMLLKTSNSTGQSKEARLVKVCAGLSSRLQEFKSENAQLEELLIAERELSRSYDARIKQLEQNLLESKNEVSRVESSMAEALAAKNTEIGALIGSMDALKKQAALSEGSLASMQANMESMMRNRELTETRMMQALREELASAERRAEEERSAHNATKMASMEREMELEHRAMEAASALARIQRVADERTSKATELEQKVALLEVECSSLNQELQDLEARARRGQKKSPEEANQLIQMQAWQEEVERARQGQRDAELKLSSMEAELQKMRVEMAAMKRDAEHYSRQEHMELEKRYRELTDLLYYKQTQLEAMASEKAAAEFQLEKEINRAQEAQVEVERSRASRRASSASWEEDAEIKSLEPLPLHHRYMVGTSVQLQKAAKLLDSGAVRATRFLWRYPTARLILLFYLVFVHLFMMYLLHRLQLVFDIPSS
ncbi:golgin candidate 1 isoform X1 [Cucumis melo var. makuwa]|uniref:Golgin candidate 1 isoform X1 n=1 Tax=Cucumis melo var. makuwa TaxID=1194695 RepID=A0A5D3CG21_CUCMM|nr:golgin candidate 1 isoform X1 [Cucumis melo var. makuwa]